MKLYPYNNSHKPFDGAVEAVQHSVNRMMMHYDGKQERENARTEALQGMLGRLLDKLIANGRKTAQRLFSV